MTNPQVGVVQEANAITDELNETRFLQQPKFSQRRRSSNRLSNHKLFRIAEALLEKRNENRRTMPTNKCSDSDDAIEKRSTQVFVLFVVEKRDYV